MLILIIRFFLVSALLVITPSHGTEKPPADKQATKGTDQQNSATKQQEITVASPPTVNVSISGKLDTATQQTQREGKGQEHDWWKSFFLEVKATDVLLALFTALLWWVTAGLRNSTDNLWKEAGLQRTDLQRSLVASEKAASAAESNAKSMADAVELNKRQFIAAHRPRLAVRRIANIQEGEKYGLRYYIHNIGDTPAIVTSITKTVWLPGRDQAARELPPYGTNEEMNREIKSGAWLGNDYFPADSALQNELRGALIAGEARNHSQQQLFFVGFVSYRDGVGTLRNMAFFRRYDFDANRFFPVDDPDYEYQD